MSSRLQILSVSNTIISSQRLLFTVYNHINRITYLKLAAESVRNMSTAGIIVIGDEILKGFTKDTNSHFLSKNFYEMGIKVEKISVIPDNVSIIASEVAHFSNKFTYVITSGGIGPTHDDVTYEGVAAAFGEKIEAHKEIADLVEKFINHLKTGKSMENSEIQEKSKTGLKMAMLPTNCKLHYNDDTCSEKKLLYPIISVRNVFIFPGIPSLLERDFNILRGLFLKDETRYEFHSKEIYVKNDEWSVTQKLNQAVEKFKDVVSFGSYPKLKNPYYKVCITVESSKIDMVDSAVEYLKLLLNEDNIANLENSSVINSNIHVYDMLKISSLHISQEFKDKLQLSLEIIDECLNKFTQDEICVCFNGGKDCTVLLHLYAAVVRNRCGESELKKINTLYVSEYDIFPEMDTFVEESVERYNLKIIKYRENIKQSLLHLSKDQQEIKATLMGTRSSDPYSSNLKPFLKTDGDWPEFMRVNPMLNWNYKDVWTFLHTLHLPYCSLYDRGYTSIGNTKNTKPNPFLKRIDSNGEISYDPAYKLEDESAERLGRI